MKIKDYLNEVKVLSINPGQTFTLSCDLGNLKKGDKVKVNDVKPYGDDVEIHLSNDSGETDTFYLDKNDDFEELSEDIYKAAGNPEEEMGLRQAKIKKTDPILSKAITAYKQLAKDFTNASEDDDITRDNAVSKMIDLEDKVHSKYKLDLAKLAKE